MGGQLADRIRYALAHPLSGGHAIDPMRELASVLREVGLEPRSGGGAVTFTGRDPIIRPLRGLAPKALAARFCGGDTGADPLLDQLPLEFGDAGDDRCHHATVGCR